MLLSDITEPYAEPYLERVRTEGLERLLAQFRGCLLVATTLADAGPRAAQIAECSREKIVAIEFELTRRGIVHQSAALGIDKLAHAANKKRRQGAKGRAA